MSYLSKESLQKVVVQMDTKESKESIFVCIKNWIVNLAKDYWNLNWEAKIGILFLIPPTIGLFYFILNLFDAGLGFESFPDNWNCIYDGGEYGYAATPAIPIYLGLMAIAGAYLIKDNLKKKNDSN